jgi:ubiquinone/menaquinone biosynthesis C-methylase UbiE
MDASRWIFNRMADVYDARPAYPSSLVDTIVELARASGKRIGDLGAGIGHLAIPLAERGFEITAVEPAHAMLERLQATAVQQGLHLRGIHAAAEALPLEAHSLDVVLIADALHFIDTELAAREISRVLVPHGALLVVTCELGTTPFMQKVATIMHEVSQRKPRQMALRSAQLAGVTGIPLSQEKFFYDETPVTHATLDHILASISFIGPAFSPERAASFRARIHALTNDYPAVWARKFTLQWGKPRRPQLPKYDFKRR